jgi:Cu-Zn family superoxide dismutase
VRRLLVVCAAAALLGGCASMTADKEPLSAEASLKDKDGKDVGRATIIEVSDGVRIVVTGYRLPPGAKGVDVHVVGQCLPPLFVSAGVPLADLGPMTVAASGEGGLDVTTKVVTLGPGAKSLLGGNGTTIIIHAQPGADAGDPAGSGGSRIACGVIVK